VSLAHHGQYEIMKIKQIIPILLLGVFAVGCKSVQPIAANTPTIVLKKPEHRPTVLGGSVDFPAGIYAPDFQTDKGIYYLAPTKIVWNALGTHRPRRGGLFVPHQNSSDQKHGAWLDQEEGSGGLIGMGATSSTRLWRFGEPVPFQIQAAESK